jgi:hypothetical protein
MDKEALKALGLTDEQIAAVVKQHDDDIKGSYIPKSRMDELNETNKAIKQQLADRDKDIEDLKKSTGDNADLTKQLADLQGKYKTDTETLNSKLKQTALNAALDLGITKAKGKNATAIKALIDSSKLAVKDDGSVDGLDALLEGVKTSDPYLFTVEETKPKGNGFHAGTLNPDAPEVKAVDDAFAAARGNF